MTSVFVSYSVGTAQKSETTDEFGNRTGGTRGRYRYHRPVGRYRPLQPAETIRKFGAIWYRHFKIPVPFQANVKPATIIDE